MAIGQTISNDAQQKILRTLCERNHSAELAYQPNETTINRYKVRFLALAEGAIVIDQPMHSGHPVPLRPDELVEMVFNWGDLRLRFNATIIKKKKWQPAGGPRLDVLLITEPRTLAKAQRRNCYRLSLIHLPTATIRLMPADNQGEPLEALMIDVSETGVGMIMPDKGVKFEQGRLYICSFNLPEDPQPIVLVGEVRWFVQDRENNRVKMGLAWQLDEENLDARRVQRRLAVFIANQQRLALRRQRDTKKG